MAARKILIVDDDPDIRALIATYLRAEGHTVLQAEDAVSCLGIAQRERPDLVLLDLGLPAGDGMTVLERLKNLRNTADIPVIVVTGRDSEESKERALALHAVDYLQKPISKDSFMATVRDALGESESVARQPVAGCPSCGQPIDLARVMDPATMERIALLVARSVVRELCSTASRPAQPTSRAPGLQPAGSR